MINKHAFIGLLAPAGNLGLVFETRGTTKQFSATRLPGAYTVDHNYPLPIALLADANGRSPLWDQLGSEIM